MRTRPRLFWLRLRHPRGKRAYMHHLVIVYRGVPVYTAALRYHYRLDFEAIRQVEAEIRSPQGHTAATLSITPLDEYSHND